jgi:hypothetical protein
MKLNLQLVEKEEEVVVAVVVGVMETEMYSNNLSCQTRSLFFQCNVQNVRKPTS